jgi:hypothetical protein
VAPHHRRRRALVEDRARLRGLLARAALQQARIADDRPSPLRTRERAGGSRRRAPSPRAPQALLHALRLFVAVAQLLPAVAQRPIATVRGEGRRSRPRRGSAAKARARPPAAEARRGVAAGRSATRAPRPAVGSALRA